MEITDKYGRTFSTLRVSLTNACNLSCVYCVHGETEPNLPAPPGVLSATTLLEIVAKLHQLLPLQTVRLTGGEPLLYKEIIAFTAGLTALGIPEIKLTTNGFLLKEYAHKLHEAGLASINVSLDAVESGAFFRISKRKNLSRILEGIDTAVAAGLHVKLNTVVMKGMNEDQVLPIFEYAKARNLTLRYLELMKMGHLFESEAENNFFSASQILQHLAEKYTFTPLPRQPAATANYWQTPDGYRFGIIANESSPFCQDCNRLRLDSQGNLYGCLSSETAIPANLHEPDEVWTAKLQQALLQKQPLRFKGSPVSMIAIGG